ncbi:spermatogenesis-associated serine-rich protein 1 [Onychomys torridus]|uniref:spermatogenesis-associated serine-rich protein 1 n=1 Tax=Onychomys torridus TaxID=38674 RepID=UPI00167FBBE5|nr:spermatogenesis-associated serine-rich protein 1 [Onychomys torridus]
MHPCFRSASWHSGGSAAGWSVDMVGAISSMESSKGEPMSGGNGKPGCQLPSISRAACARDLEKVPEKSDLGMTKVERRYNAKHSDALESKGSLANKMASDRRASLLSSDEAGLRVPEPPGSTGVVIHSDTAAEMGQKSSSSSSSPSSAQSSRSLEFSLPGFQKETYPEEFSLLKSQTKDGQRPEWTFYPRFSSNVHTYHVGKQCFFSGVFRGNRRSVAEQTVDKSLGRKRYDIDPRNGIPKLTPGDNPYMLPEQSKEFFKAGATLPPANFSLIPYEKKFDTFIPLEPLPQIPNLPFWEKEKANNLKNEIKEVKELDNWHPPPPFLHSFFSSGTGEMAPRLRVLAALPEDKSTVVSTQVGRLTIPYNSSNFFWPHRISSHVLHIHAHTYTHK